jgi:hypothetical protein
VKKWKESMNKSRFARMLQWCHDYPWAITGFFLGVGVGILTCLPLVPYVLPDSSAVLIGSFLGAGVAVTGAIWVTTIKERRFRADLRLAAIVIYKPFIFSIEECMSAIVALAGQTEPLDITAKNALVRGKNLSTVTRASFENLRPAFTTTPNDIIVHSHLLGAIDRFIGFIDAETQRDMSRNQRQQEDRQAAFNSPNVHRTVPQPVNTDSLQEAIKNAESVMSTVGY